jgi:hypothetical protein
VAEGEHESGDDSDWSEGRQGIIGTEVQQGRKGEVNLLRIGYGEENGMSGGDPTLLGITSDVVPVRVNYDADTKGQVGVAQKRTCVIETGETKGSLNEGSVELCHGCKGGGGFILSQAADVVGQKEGIEVPFQTRDSGPFQPKSLRTKAGDIPFVETEGGAVSKGVLEGSPICVGLGGSVSAGPVVLIPDHSHVGLEKGGRSKKVMKRPTTIPPGTKLSRFQEITKANKKYKKKKGRGGAKHQHLSASTESDPIDSSMECSMAAQSCQHHFQQQVNDLNGIGLEVVLSPVLPDEGGLVSVEVPIRRSSGGGGLGSGLEDLLGDAGPELHASPVSGGLVDKDRGDAYHIIDIQEDIGMNFKGVGEEDVDRGVWYEGRDRKLKNDCVLDQGHQ